MPAKFTKQQGPAALAPAKAELLLPYPMGQLDSREDDAGIGSGLEAENAVALSFDGAVILLDNGVQVLAGANFDLYPFGVLAP